MRKWISYMGLLILFACTSDEMVIPGVLPDVPPLSSDELLIHVLFPDMQQATKAVTEAKELKIDSLLIFIFKDEAGTPAVCKDNKFVSMIVVHNDSIKQQPAPEPAKVKLKVKKPSAGNIRFVLVPNTPEVHKLRPKLNALEADVSTAGDLMNLLRVPAAGWMQTDLADSSCEPLPMWGTSGFYNAASLETTASIVVHMTRALARIEVGVDINNPAGGDPAIGFGSVFRIDSVYLCNVNDSVRITPPNTAEPDKDGLYSGIISARKVPLVRYKFAETEGRTMQRTIYAPETDSLIIQANDTIHKPPFLVLRAKYYDDDYYYYRVDFTGNNAYKPLLRNRTYTVNITGVRTVGYKTLDEAMAAPVLPLNPSLVIGAQEATINSLVYSNQYWLGCEGTEVKVDWKYTGTAAIKAGTSYPAGWKAELVSGSWINNMSTTASQIFFNVEENLTGATRTAQIKLSAGSLAQYINLSQSPGSHTYMAKDAGSDFTIPLTAADADGIQRSSQIKKIRYYIPPLYEIVNGVKTPKFEPEAWVPAGNTFSISKDSLAKARTASQNIILVTAYDAADAPLWAWTVWALPAGHDYELPGYQQYYNGYTFMPQNLLGGQPFQWGRKDPALFPDRDTVYVSVPPAVTLEESLRNPRAFYLSDAAPYNYLNIQNNNLWTSIDGEKGPYDPCPFGWRVPPAGNDKASPLDGFGYLKNGIKLTGTVWGASARGTDAYTYVVPEVAGAGVHSKARRTDAHPIRCVRDVKRLGGSLIITN